MKIKSLVLSLLVVAISSGCNGGSSSSSTTQYIPAGTYSLNMNNVTGSSDVCQDIWFGYAESGIFTLTTTGNGVLTEANDGNPITLSMAGMSGTCVNENISESGNSNIYQWNNCAYNSTTKVLTADLTASNVVQSDPSQDYHCSGLITLTGPQ